MSTTRKTAATKRKPSARERAIRRLKNYHRELGWLLAAALLLLVGVMLRPASVLSTADISDLADADISGQVPMKLWLELKHAKEELAQFEDAEVKNDMQIVPDTVVADNLNVITTDLRDHNYRKAHTDLQVLLDATDQWNGQLRQGLADRVASQAAEARPSVTPVDRQSQLVPILMYHHPPADFEAQLKDLRARGYVAIDPGRLAAGLKSQLALPKKPVMITFDDGFADQLQAFSLLQRYQMPATFYIISGGPESKWCIGAGRRYHDPLQPAQGCGDAYLSWDQVRQLDRSGLITIAAHTVNHRNLAALPADQQWYEIHEGKTELESELGHPVLDFAYPYGAFNATSLSEVQRAGFRTAVTTLPGTYQTAGGLLELHRVRSAYALP